MSYEGVGRFLDRLKGRGDVDTLGNVVTGDSFQSPDGIGKYMRLSFDCTPIFKGKVLANGTTLAHAAPTGAAGDENVMMYPEGSLEWHVLGTQTLLAFLPVATGLDISQDDTSADGTEICAGILASNRLAFTVGTDAAFYAKMRFDITTVAGTDDCAFGFRKAEAYQANLDDYDEMACLNVIAGTITIETILNGGTTTTTSTTDTWADAETHELEVRVSAAGVVTYKIDGRSPTTTAAFTFDDGEVVVPFLYILNNATTYDAAVLKSFECGLQ
jgi:hypothetical protein